MRLLDAICATPWAIRPEALRAILSIASREDISREAIARAMTHGADGVAEHLRALPAEAVAARQGRRLAKTKKVEVRNGVAIVPVEGPIFRYAGMFDDVSGASSVQILAPDFNAALEDPEVAAIMLHVDSPGGEINGIGEFGDMIFGARGRKPITAYVSFLGASAAYWLASAADRIVVSETAALGSIGAVMAVRDPARDEGGEIEFVSSKSPMKHADPNSDAGRDQYQSLVDSWADIFIAAVARNRGVSTETVEGDFGAGGLLIGRGAVEAGLADAIGSYEQTLRELSERASPAVVPVGASRDPMGAARMAPGSHEIPTGGGKRMGMRDTFFAWLDGLDAGASAETPTAEPLGSAASPRQEAAIVTDNLSHQPPAPASGGAAPPTPAPAADHGAIRLAELEAENRRLRAERIHDRATAFADEQVRGMKAFPAERDGLVALYAQVAADDEQFGPVATASGATTRATLLSAALAARPSASHLTAEALGPAVAHVLHAQATTPPRPGDGPLTEERRETLLKQSHLGQAVVNGRPHST